MSFTIYCIPYLDSAEITTEGLHWLYRCSLLLERKKMLRGRKIENLSNRRIVFCLVVLLKLLLIASWIKSFTPFFRSGNPLSRVANGGSKDNSPVQLKTLRDIQQFIWNNLDGLQSYGNCEDKLILYCAGHTLAGIGSMLFRYGACLQVAFALGRTMFIDQKEYKHFGGLNNWIRLESEKCGWLKEKYRNHTDRCNLDERRCYLNGNILEVNNSIKVLEFYPRDMFPIPRYVPSTIPSFIEKPLIKLNIKNPWLWFSSQFLGYMVLRTNTKFQKLLANIKSNISYSNIALSLHIRRGDKITTGEAAFIPDERYIQAVSNIFDKKNIKTLNEINKTRIVYIASDDQLLNISKKFPSNYVIKRLPSKYLSGGLQSYFTPRFPRIILESILIDIHLLTHTNFTICTMSSNVCRLVNLLKNAVPPYNVTNRVVTLDRQELFGKYYWSYFYIVPLNNFYVTVKRQENSSLDINGTTFILNYNEGYLYRFAGKKVKVADGLSSYLYLMVPVYQATQTNHYILQEDMIEWPGRPEYPAFA